MKYSRLHGKTKKYRIRNTAIRQSLKMESTIKEIAEKGNLRRNNKLIRMNNKEENKTNIEARS